ncbi:MAG: M14-type cytosolic carboxypeptidase [Asticcacaulis sp.]|uniref:M14 family metallopeptidase n=1 Tax=Asticcacaulis sp. TaxID=1872648 RepID=UPI0039E277FB
MSITITADFDGGNIEVLSGQGGAWDLAIRPDHNSHYYQWFYFRVDGAAGVDLTLRLTNAGGSAYTGGWENYRARVSTDNADWLCADTSYENGVLTIRHRTDADTLWFAYFAPFDSQRHRAFVAQVKTLPGMAHRVLGQTLDGRDLDLFTLGDGPAKVWLYARQHPGETMAEWWMEGAIAFLPGSDPAAQHLRQAATFYIVLNMNPDGSARGHLRTNAAGVDLNREWGGPTMERSPEIVYVLDAMQKSGVDFAIDVHGDEAIPHVFMAGFEGTPSWSEARAALYQSYLDRLMARTADFQTTYGYDIPGPGAANLAISTNAVAERFTAIAMTLEMPFKDHDDAPEPVRAWSPDRSRKLGETCLLALADIVEAL